MSRDAETTLAAELRARRQAGNGENQNRIFTFTLNDRPPFGFSIQEHFSVSTPDRVAARSAVPRAPLQPLPPSLIPSPPPVPATAGHDINIMIRTLRGLLPDWDPLMEPDVHPSELLQFLDILVRQHIGASTRRHPPEESVTGDHRISQAQTMLRFARRHLTCLRARAQRSEGPELYQSIGVLCGLIGATGDLLTSLHSSDIPVEDLDSEPNLEADTLSARETEEPEASDEDENDEEVRHARTDYYSTRSSTPEREIGECPGNHKGINRDYHCYARWTGMGWRCYFCLGDM
ncbi:uncharacterized protein CcaverHIS019_0602860 [Cutaneotrichosporon cavernicola]|uniref:Uncharacterized protein n=1 Tax=Cutaneotrichosporon cavernicola TaxID=279322 RepID=A0AA48QXW5_9TREE|nr:uncharacterized protein CcaverHIS019_0602860 [Cutaneotrichosporon cavernicola]BEI93827.1 hypothetical protein CcaverHIS019_0602860 [Cutaneotrichosporon cavernicola]BEJ01603.1 hypothetical protein CcaverHIS631_0602850 [Cutaneotrichosporon cavernicola]